MRPKLPLLALCGGVILGQNERNLRLVNTADYSARAAAPGSLVSVIGGRVDSARGAGLNYPVLAASDTESQLQVPFEGTGTNVVLAWRTRAGLMTLGLPVQLVSPAIMVRRDGVPVLLDADSGLEIEAHNPAQLERPHADSGDRFRQSPTGLADRAGRADRESSGSGCGRECLPRWRALTGHPRDAGT
jgi:hypothetical protein